jgi:SpoVK/Ycf46/Vps4 family AAA+-type ATPase
LTDLALPTEAAAQLRQIAGQISGGPPLVDRRPSATGSVVQKGTAALFTGPSGTSKTLAAEALATELKLELFRIDLGAVVSRQVGETEKNLDTVFADAPKAGAILFFDEADALFGKRTQVSDAHDRYANAESNYLLERIEQFAGLTILAANRRENVDEVVIQRVRFVIDFP